MGLFDIPNNCFQAKLQGGSCIQQSLKLLWPRSLSERQSHIFDGCNFWQPHCYSLTSGFRCGENMTQLDEIWDCIILILTELPGTTRRLSWGTASGSGHITQQLCRASRRPGDFWKTDHLGSKRGVPYWVQCELFQWYLYTELLKIPWNLQKCKD